jgi:hypothetical protein
MSEGISPSYQTSGSISGDTYDDQADIIRSVSHPA